MKIVVKRIIACALFAALFFIVDPRQLVATFSRLSVASVAVLLAISLVMVYMSALKWKVLLGEKRYHVSTSRLLKLYLIGYFINSFFPSFVAGDALRSSYLGRTVGQKDAAVATILERASGLVAMVFFAAVAVWILPDALPRLRTFISVAAAATALGVIAAFDRRCMNLLPEHRYTTKLKVARARAIDLLRHPARLTEVIFLSLLFQAATIFNTWSCCVALGWDDVSIGQLCVAVPIVLLLSALPVTPSGLGLQESAFYYFLKRLGASAEIALGVGLLLRAKTYALALIGGVFWLLEKDSVSIYREESPSP